MRSQLLLVPVLLAALPLSGCLGAPTAPAELPAPAESGVRVDPDTGDTLFLKPNWTVGRWWDVYLATDFGFGFLVDIYGRLIVSQQNSTGFVVGSDQEGVGIFDSYFDSFYVGPFDADLNPHIAGTRVQFYQWPLRDGLTWTDRLPAQGFDQFEGDQYQTQFNVTRFDEEDAALGPRLRVQALTDHGETLDYDYSPRTGWMTYFRMLNASTGQVIVKVDLRAHGTDYVGPVHHVTQTSLYERFVLTPPFDPVLAPVPPVEAIDVPADYAWVEEIKFLFTFTVEGVGGGVVAAAVTRPDGSNTRSIHVGGPGEFSGAFNRTQVRGATTGQWTVSVLPAATGGAFVGLFGFVDDIRTLQA